MGHVIDTYQAYRATALHHRENYAENIPSKLVCGGKCEDIVHDLWRRYARNVPIETCIR